MTYSPWFGWTDNGACTLTATTTNPTKGTTSRDKVSYRRVGENMEIRFEYNQTAGGASGSGDYLFLVPGGYSVDTTKLNAYTASVGVLKTFSSVGVCSVCDGSSEGTGAVEVYDATRLRFEFQWNNAASVSRGTWGSAVWALGATTTRITALISVPISGWQASL